jgi:hypothetical protein
MGRSAPKHSIGTETAIALYQSGWWRERPAKEVALFQLQTAELSLPFSEFGRVLKEATGRYVTKYELSQPESLIAEIMGERPAPTHEELAQLLALEQFVDLVRGGRS